MVGKRGSEKYYFIVALVLGIIILTIGLFFLFHELFVQKDIDWEVCRQSLVLRSGNSRNIVKLFQENSFPFRCKTQVVEIDFKNYTKAGEIIMETMQQCWYLFGEGDLQLYASGFFNQNVRCFHCARIHFDEEVVEFYSYGQVEELKNKFEELKKKLTEDWNKVLNEEYGVGENIDASSKEYSLLDKNFKEKYSAVILEKEELEERINKFSNPNFHWNNFLAEKIKKSEMTYGQYFYGWDKVGILKPNAWEKEAFAKSVKYLPNFDAKKGDLIISVVFKSGSWAVGFGKSRYSLIIPHQVSQELICKVETIPA